MPIEELEVTNPIPMENIAKSIEDMNIKQHIIYLLRKTARPGINNLIAHMEENGFFTAPCSGQYHGCKEGGLAVHSLNVCEMMCYLHLNTDIFETIDNHSIIIASLLHDMGKAAYHNKPNYVPNILKSGKQSEDKPFTTNQERLYISHEIVSIQIVSKYIELTEEEEFAILYHNGLYTSSGRDIQGKERPLQQLLHFCDMWCSRFTER